MDTEAPTQTYPVGKHPQLAPPPTERGVVKWLRERLLNSWYNAVGTVLILYIAYLGIPPLLDWFFFDAVWEAKNNKDCWAQGEGACWGFISKRFLFFMYGFYDSASYWRPNTVGVILVITGAIVVFPRTPDIWKRYTVSFLIFIFPWIAVGLLVGPVRFSSWDTTGGQAVTALAFVLGVYVGWRGHQSNDALKRLLGLSVIYIVLVMLFLTWGLGMDGKESRSFGGLLLTLVLAITSISVSLPLGILLALGRRANDMPALKYFCVAVIELFRAVPLITVLFMAVFMIPLFLPQGMSFDDVVSALIGMIIFNSAYMAEIVRGGLQAIPRGQYEAGDSIGLNFYLSTRLVVMPQALKIVIPGIVSLFIGIFKDSSLVSIIGLFDILNVAKTSITDSKWIGLEWEGYAFVALLFWTFCFSMSRYSQWLEKQLNREHSN